MKRSTIATFVLLSLALTISVAALAGGLGFLLGRAQEPTDAALATSSKPCAEINLLRGNEQQVYDCEVGQDVAGILRMAGASDARVRLTRIRPASLADASTELHVVAQIALPRRAIEDWDGPHVADLIARSVGTRAEFVTIIDPDLVLWSGDPINGSHPDR